MTDPNNKGPIDHPPYAGEFNATDFTPREVYLAGLSFKGLLAEALRLDAMLTAERLMAMELATRAAHPLMTIRTDQDRHADFLLKATELVMKKVTGTADQYITSTAAAIANDLFDRHMAKWARESP